MIDTLERSEEKTAEPERWRNRYRFEYDIKKASVKVDGLPITNGWESLTPTPYPSREAALEAHHSEAIARAELRTRYSIAVNYLGAERDT